MKNMLLKRKFRIVLIFTMSCILASCNYKDERNKCFKLNNQALIYLGTKALIDSAVFYNQKAIECNPNSKIILSTRYSIYKQKKDAKRNIK